MREGSGLVEFSRRFPDRYFDVGIAEQHAVTFCGGLAAAGMRPIMAIYSTFLQRGYDQLIHDIALQNLPVIFAVDRAGIVGADGATHHGVFDLSYARCLPNLTVAAPSDENELWRALNAALALDSPTLVRYPRGAGAGAAIESESQAAPLGRGIVAREGGGTAILAFGSMLAPALEAGEKIDAAVADMRFVKPLDGDLILRLADRCERIVTVEENMRAGGGGRRGGGIFAAIGAAQPAVDFGAAGSLHRSRQAGRIARRMRPRRGGNRKINSRFRGAKKRENGLVVRLPRPEMEIGVRALRAPAPRRRQNNAAVFQTPKTPIDLHSRLGGRAAAEKRIQNQLVFDGQNAN